MGETTLEQSSEWLRLALPLMARNQVPVTPENYWVWYQYVSGGIAPLNETIDRAFEHGEMVDEAATRALYKRYIEDPDQKHLSQAEDTVRRLLETITDSLNSADNEVSRYEASLGECADELSHEITTDGLRNLVDALTRSTQRMHEGAVTLHANLDESRDEVRALRHELEQVRAQAKIDPLTKLANRFGFDDGISALRARNQSDGSGHGLLIADIDRFKSVNDRYGHLFGDKILKVVAKAIAAIAGPDDIVARFGGEEFVIVLNDADLDSAAATAEKLRAGLEAGRIFNPKTNAEIERITVSVGVTDFDPNEPVEAAIGRADEALYEAKNNGRNRITIARRDQPAAVANG
jgi:diguanylate cyclase